MATPNYNSRDVVIVGDECPTQDAADMIAERIAAAPESVQAEFGQRLARAMASSHPREICLAIVELAPRLGIMIALAAPTAIQVVSADGRPS